jgi:hypothetical protein
MDLYGKLVCTSSSLIAFTVKAMAKVCTYSHQQNVAMCAVVGQKYPQHIITKTRANALGENHACNIRSFRHHLLLTLTCVVHVITGSIASSPVPQTLLVTKTSLPLPLSAITFKNATRVCFAMMNKVLAMPAAILIVLRELNGLGREMNENYNLSFKHSCILHCNAWLDFVEHRKIQKFVHRNNDLANLILSDIGKRSSLSRHGLHV